jgi:membrane protease YdiL (CAAX protease family)
MFDPSVMFEAAVGENARLALALYGALFAAGVIVCLVLVSRWRRGPSDWSRRVRIIRDRPWDLTDAGIIVLVLLNLQVVLFAIHRVSPEDSSPFSLILSSLAFHGAGLVLVAGRLRIRRVSWQDAFGLDNRGLVRQIGRGIVFYAAVIPFLLFSSFLYQFVLSLSGYVPTIQPVAELLTEPHAPWMQVYLLALAIGIAPIFEELLFRGVGIPLIARRLGTGPAVVLTSLAFAGLHFHVPSLVPLFVISAGFSVAYLHSGSIVVPIVMHSIFNGINIAMLTALR